MRRAALVLLALLPLLLSGRALDGTFLLDDRPLVADNPAVRSLGASLRAFVDPAAYSVQPLMQGHAYRPVMVVSLAVTHALGGGEPRAHRVGNLLAHGLAAAIAFLLGLRLAKDPAVAFVAAAAFAVHPVSLFSAQYISNRGLVLMTLFGLAALWRLLEDRPGQAAACLALSVLSKENGVMWLPVMGLLEWLVRGAGWREAGRRLAPSGVVVAVLVGLRPLLGVGADQGIRRDAAVLARYLATQTTVFFRHYLWNLVWPSGVRFEPSVHVVVFGEHPVTLASLALAAAAGGAVAIRRRAPLVALGVLAFPLPLVPTWLLVQPLWALHYRPYPASFLLLLALAWTARGALAGARGRWLAGALLIALGAAGLRQGGLAVTEEAAWRHAVRYGGTSRAELALALAVRDPALQEQALDKLVRRFPGFPRGRWYRGRLRLARRNWAGALEDMAVAVEALAGVDPARVAKVRAGAGGTDPVGAVQEAVALTRESGQPALARDMERVLGAVAGSR